MTDKPIRARVWRYVDPDGTPINYGGFSRQHLAEIEWEFGVPGPQLPGEDPKQIGIALITPGRIQRRKPFPGENDD